MDKLLFKKLTETARIPKRATSGSAGLDMFADITGNVMINPGETAAVGCGVAVELPSGTVGLVFGRSGLSVRHGIAPANCVGVIDSDYRGEIKVGLFNHSKTSYEVSPGERIAQLVVMPFLELEPAQAAELSETERGEGGFSSTGSH